MTNDYQFLSRWRVDGTSVRVMQTGFEESDRWRRYYEVIGHGWDRALASLKGLLEK